MARVDQVRPWNLPIGFCTPAKDKKPTNQDVIDWNKQNPNGFQRLTYLTLGGIVATLFGALTSVGRESKSGSLFGAVLALLGIVGTVTGFICAPDLNEEVKADEPKKSDLKDDELINILKESKKLDERIKAARELGRRKINSAVDLLIEFSKNKIAKARAQAATALGDIGTEKAIERLKQLWHDTCQTVKRAVESALRKNGINSEAAN